jgi:hypothetical protein
LAGGRRSVQGREFPPVDPTRRHLLTIAAGGAVAAAIPIDVGIPTSAATAKGINLSANTINVLAPKTPLKEITPSQSASKAIRPLR